MTARKESGSGRENVVCAESEPKVSCGLFQLTEMTAWSWNALTMSAASALSMTVDKDAVRISAASFRQERWVLEKIRLPRLNCETSIFKDA